MNEPCYYRVSVKALITGEGGRFLLAKESDGTWDLLGGGLEHDENPVEAIEREVSEETGLTVTHVSPTPKYFVTALKPSADVYMANVIFEVTVKDLEDFTPSDECQELRYFNADEARAERLLPWAEKFVNAYNPSLHVA